MPKDPYSIETVSLSDAERKLMDTQPSSQREEKLAQLQSELAKLNQSSGNDHGRVSLPAALVKLDIAGLLLDLDNKQDAWTHARECVDTLIEHEHFEDAAFACQLVYLADQSDAIHAIGMAAWLTVAYPVNPVFTANILNHIIDETPDDSDGGAVAAAAAHYVMDLRTEADDKDDLRLYTGEMLARVARRHSDVETQQMFELWVERMELDIPEKFLIRLRNVIDVMVQDEWWFDRDALQAAMPNE